MPLVKSKSKAARQENAEREVSAGKDPKQAEAIAYSVQRREAAAAKGRASQAHAKGKISDEERAKAHAEADRAMGLTFHTHKGN